MRNLVRLFSKADPSDGIEWYKEGNLFCAQVAGKYGLELSTVCAILSALSPGTNWEQNKKDCINLIKANGNAHTKQFRFTTYGQNVIKAQNIFTGRLLPDDAFSMKTGAKTYNFYRNLLDPTNPHPVTIDRHAFTIATGDTYTKLTLKQYEVVADHYRRAADKIGILANQLQAILWVDYRKQNDISFQPFNLF